MEFLRTINWNKYLTKPELLVRNANLNHLNEPRFQSVKRLFVLAFKDNAQRVSNKKILYSRCKNKRLQCND